VQAEHSADFAEFLVDFDNFHSTHAEENRELSSQIYLKLRDAGHIAQRSITQYFDPEKKMFLADRFIKGTCPKCGTEDQYGDNCEKCGATYADRPEGSEVGHLRRAPGAQGFPALLLQAADFQQMLQTWTRSGTCRTPWPTRSPNGWTPACSSGTSPAMRRTSASRFRTSRANTSMCGWTRRSATWRASRTSATARRSWTSTRSGADSTAELYHFIGKDIVNFHALFWPAMLEGAGFRKPTGINVHGYLTVNGQKMSKSAARFITARTYLDHLSPECLRYYYAAKLGRGRRPRPEPRRLSQKVNSDLVGKVVNIASRCAGFIHKATAACWSTTTPRRADRSVPRRCAKHCRRL
jgi:methionyl-tRNA synthetase